MQRVAAVVGVVVGTVVLVGPPPPAGAAVTASTTGTTVQVAMTGTDAVGFACISGKAIVTRGPDIVIPEPELDCSVVTSVIITGDVSSQVVDGSGLDAAAFTAKPGIQADLGGGFDRVTESLAPDVIDLGPGNDQLVLRPGGSQNAALQMGDGALDEVWVTGTDLPDSISITSTGASATISLDSPTVSNVWTVGAAEYLAVASGKGNDFLIASGVTSASDLERVVLEGQDGSDNLQGGGVVTESHGGSGPNTFTTGSGPDEIYTDAEGDTINGPGDSANDRVIDGSSLRMGGRSLTGFDNLTAAKDTFAASSTANDLTARVRPGASSSATVTFSLNRMGQQLVPGGFEEIDLELSGLSTLTPRTLADIVVPSADVTIGGQTSGKELIDVTVPTGTWTVDVDGDTRTIATSLGTVTLPATSPFQVHGPWTNANQGFGHRVYRDLLLRFATTAERDAVRDQLANGSTTRAQVVSSIVATDAYRGLDVDRVFLRYLRRAADPGGRTYWIGSLRNGKSLRQFRAQLFGSNEYFSKAGGTNAKFVERAYEDVLGRKPDPSGLAYWTNKANNGTERGLIARQFLSSAEAKRTIVRDQYLRFLDRQPTQPEIDAGIAALDTYADGEQRVISTLASGAAYFNRS